MYRVILLLLLVACTTASVAQNEKLKKLEVQGDTAMSQQDYLKAIKIFSKVIKSSKLKNPGDYNAVYKRAVSYYSVGQFPKALEDLNIIVPKFPDLPQGKMLRAIVYRELGQKDKAKEDLATALVGDPANPGLMKWRASVYIEDEEYNLAKKDLMMARLFEDDAETEMYLGVAQYNTGAVDSAFLSLNKAIQLDATYLPAYLYAGSFALQEDQFEKSLEYLDFAGRLDPDNLNIVFYKGIALVELDRTDEGCRYLRKAFYAGEDDASGYLKEYCFGTEN